MFYLFVGKVELNSPDEWIVQLVVLALVPRSVVVGGQRLEVAVEIHASSQGGIPPAEAPSKIDLIHTCMKIYFTFKFAVKFYLALEGQVADGVCGELPHRAGGKLVHLASLKGVAEPPLALLA